MIDLQQILFWIFSSIMLLTGALVILRNDVVNSAMFLIQVFLCMAGIFLLLEAFFLAIVQVLVYAGAVVVLFLFVTMLLHPGQLVRDAFTPLANAGALVTFLALGAVTTFVVLGLPDEATDQLVTAQGGLREVVQPIFRMYLLPFLLTALVLLSAMIGVVVLTKKDSDADVE